LFEICHGEAENACCTRLKGEPYQIHPYPSAEISNSGGDIIIRQGDEAHVRISFVGTPPFSFTLTRFINEINDYQNEVIDNIADYEYNLSVNEVSFQKSALMFV
jgi:hypothetical protein